MRVNVGASQALEAWVFTALFLISSTCIAEDLAESFPQLATRAKVAIIIDDLGYQFAPAEKLVSSPYALTLAIIPFTPYGKKIAELAHQSDKEIMLHTPMETVAPRPWENALISTMTQSEMLHQFSLMIEDIPHIRGVNNHGGSKLTQEPQHMEWLMHFLQELDVYFVDSRTIASSVAQSSAKKALIPHGVRDIFLDNDKAHLAIQEQLQKLKTLSLSRGYATAIGHPYSETIEVLNKELPNFVQEGIQIVPMSQLTSPPNPTTLASKLNSQTEDNSAIGTSSALNIN